LSLPAITKDQVWNEHAFHPKHRERDMNTIGNNHGNDITWINNSRHLLSICWSIIKHIQIWKLIKSFFWSP